MKNRKVFSVLLVIVLMCSPILSLLINNVRADSTNLAPITSWGVADYYPGNTFAENNHLDYSVEYRSGTPSIRSDPPGAGCTNYARECDSQWIAVSPGDHIVFSCWIKTSASTLGENNNNDGLYNGAIIGMDFYADARITATNQQNGAVPQYVDGSFVFPPLSGDAIVFWNTGVWTQVTIDFTVGSSYPSDGSNYQAGQMVVPSGIILWLGVGQVDDGGQAWFADPSLYVTPSGSPTPSPLPSSTHLVVSNIALGQSFVESGFVLPINVSVQNSDSVSEGASVELFANSTSIFNGTIDVDGLASRILNCPVNTESLPIGNYTISVSVIPSDEPNAMPSTMSVGNVGVTYVGDLMGHFKVDFKDVSDFVSDYIEYNNNGVYNPAADFNHDGKIDFTDLQTLINAYINYTQQQTYT
jgi:hypothetical protein